MADLGKNICSMIECRAGEHCLFRSFGLGGNVDSPNTVTRNGLQVAVNKWFPATVIKSLDVERASITGEFIYKINIQGA